MSKKNIQLEYETIKISNAMLLTLHTSLKDSDNFDFKDIQTITLSMLVTVKNFLEKLGVPDIKIDGRYKNLQSAIDKINSKDFFSYLTEEDIKNILKQVQEKLPDILYENSYQLKKLLIDGFN